MTIVDISLNMKNSEDSPKKAGNFTLKERLELERWAKLNGMTLEEYLESGIRPDMEAYRKLRRRTARKSEEGNAS